MRFIFKNANVNLDLQAKIRMLLALNHVLRPSKVHNPKKDPIPTTRPLTLALYIGYEFSLEFVTTSLSWKVI